ncbi:MAG: hypothetical protein AAGB24_08565 [Bacteroidota bacterium]
MEARKYKRNPKQDFKVNWSEIIVSDKLTSDERILLLYILRHHKTHCKLNYKELFNDQICKDLDISKPTLNKHRKGLEDKNFITIKTIMNGRLVKLSREKRKSSPLVYHPTFTKLKKLNLITEETNSFKDKYDDRVQSNSSKIEKFPLVAGDQILPEHLKHFKGNKKYDVITVEMRGGFRWVQVAKDKLIASQIESFLQGNAIPRKFYYEKYTPPVIELKEGQEITTVDISTLSGNTMFRVEDVHYTETGEIEKKVLNMTKKELTSMQDSCESYNRDAGKTIRQLFYKGEPHPPKKLTNAEQLQDAKDVIESKVMETTTVMPDNSILEENDEILDKFLKENSIEKPEPKDEVITEEEADEKIKAEVAAMIESIERDRRRKWGRRRK